LTAAGLIKVRQNIMFDLRSSAGRPEKPKPPSSMPRLMGEACQVLRKAAAQTGGQKEAVVGQPDDSDFSHRIYTCNF
jgi:hypothetical protein